jgi:hypothetical protein
LAAVACATAAFAGPRPAAAQGCLVTDCFSMNAAAEIIQLRKDCSNEANCCVTSAALTQWIGACWDQTGWLLVDVGPGAFDRLRCGQALTPGGPPEYWNVTFRGAGVDVTTFQTSCPFGDCLEAALEVGGTGCFNLEFEDMTFLGGRYGIIWRADAGDSTWTNTKVVGATLGWYEFTIGGATPQCDTQNLATHVWFDSQIEGQGNPDKAAAAYQANCGESHFYNVDLVLNMLGGNFNPNEEGVAALQIGANRLVDDLQRRAVVRLIGSTVRVVAPTWIGKADDGIVAGIAVHPNGTLQMHDGLISVEVAGMNPSDVYAIRADLAHVFEGGSNPAAVVNAAGAAFKVVRSGTEPTPQLTPQPTPTPASLRIGDPAVQSLQAPYLWPADTDVPRPKPGSAFQIASMTGADLFVETDCAAAECTSPPPSPAQQQPHLLIYNATCPSRWFDSTSKQCR